MEPTPCQNCEELIAHSPVYFNGAPFCCVGCVAGGPCTCTYRDEPVPEVRASSAPAPRARSAVAPKPRPVRPAAPSTARAAVAPPTEGASTTARGSMPLRPFAGVPIVIHVTGLASQRDFLAFAGAIESRPELAEVSLTRITSTDAWLSARAASADTAAAALLSVPGYEAHTDVDQNLVEVIATPLTYSGAAEPSTWLAPETEEPADTPVLPPRPRFRVFSPSGPNGTGTGQPSTPSVPAAAQYPAAQRPTPRPPAAQPPAARPPATQPPVARPAPPVPSTPSAPPAPPAPPAPASRPAARAGEAVPRTPEAPARSAPAAATSSQRAQAPGRPVSPAPASAPPRRGPVSPSGAPSEPRNEEYVNPEERPGGAVMTSDHLTLIAYPFNSFAALNEFQAAVRGLHGVKSTRVRRFYRGTLHLAVDYEDMIPLSERLGDLRGFDLEVTSETRSEVEVMLRETGSLAAAGGN